MKRSIRNQNRKRWLVCLGAAAVLSMLPCAAGSGFSELSGSIEAAAQEISYDQLRGLLTEGNASVKYSSYYTNLSNVENQLSVLREEVQQMMALSRLDESESQERTSEEYKSIAHTLTKSIKQQEKQLKKLTGSSASINQTLDMLEMQAQSAYIACLTAEANAQAAEKTAAASELKYNSQLSRQTVGMATESDVTSAHASMLDSQVQAASMRQQADKQRRSLLQLLGLPDDGSVSFAEVAAPELAEIAAIDPAADLERAINNDAQVKSARHAHAAGTVQRNLKDASEEEAIGNATADYNEAYTLLLGRVAEYQAADSAMGAAENSYKGALLKKNNGMLTEADWLLQEAAYIRSQAACRTACMNLRAAYENYKWLLKGTA